MSNDALRMSFLQTKILRWYWWWSSWWSIIFEQVHFSASCDHTASKSNQHVHQQKNTSSNNMRSLDNCCGITYSSFMFPSGVQSLERKISSFHVCCWSFPSQSPTRFLLRSWWLVVCHGTIPFLFYYALVHLSRLPVSIAEANGYAPQQHAALRAQG